MARVFKKKDDKKDKPAPELEFVDVSGKPFNIINAADFRFWELLNQVVVFARVLVRENRQGHRKRIGRQPQHQIIRVSARDIRRLRPLTRPAVRPCNFPAGQSIQIENAQTRVVRNDANLVSGEQLIRRRMNLQPGCQAMMSE